MAGRRISKANGGRNKKQVQLNRNGRPEGRGSDADANAALIGQ